MEKKQVERKKRRNERQEEWQQKKKLVIHVIPNIDELQNHYAKLISKCKRLYDFY